MAPEHDGQARKIRAGFHKAKGVVKVDDPLGQAAHRLAFAFIVAGGIIGKNHVAIGSEIVRHIHIGAVAASAKAMGQHHHALGGGGISVILVAGQHLALMGGKGVPVALEAVEVLQLPCEGFIGGKALAEIVVVYAHGQGFGQNQARGDHQRKQDGQYHQNDFKGLLSFRHWNTSSYYCASHCIAAS